MNKTVIVASDEMPPLGWGIGQLADTLFRELTKDNSINAIALCSGFKDKENVKTYGKKLGLRGDIIRKIWTSYKVITSLSNNDTVISCHPVNTIIFALINPFVNNRPKFIIIFHGSDVYKINSFVFGKTVKNWIKKQTSVSISHYVKRTLKEVLNVDSNVIYNAISRRFEYNEIPLHLNKHSMLMVGRLDLRKGHKSIFDAIRMLPPSHRKLIKLTIVGSGPHEKLIRDQARGLEDVIHFTGHVNDDKLIELYRENRFFVFPSIEYNDRVEGFGLVLLEAISQGCIPIISDSGGHVEILGHSYSLMYANLNELKSILMSLGTIDNNSIEARKILEKFSIETFVNAYKSML